MQRWLCAGTLAALLAAAPSVHAAGGAPARNGWLADYAKARAVARQTGKPLFVVFRCQP